jgi:hypothetical protein
MVVFEYADFRIEAIAEMKRYDYKDANNIGRTRFDRTVSVTFQFDSFVIDNDFYELAMVKSTLNYFMQAYWKRRSKQEPRIVLATSLDHNYGAQKLNFTAKQKNDIPYLEFSLINGGLFSTSMYLSGQEVIMLDIAISKAISLMTPETVTIGN